MLQLRPLTDSFALPYKYDPAFDTDGSHHTQPGAKKKKWNYEAEFARCLVTLDFAPITRPGLQPTLFVFRPLRLHEVRRFRDRNAGSAIAPWLIFRLCLESVENGGSDLDKLERSIDGEYPDVGMLLGLKQTEALDDVPRLHGRPVGELITQLGDEVFRRSTQLSPP
jgi:hypothetical protein